MNNQAKNFIKKYIPPFVIKCGLWALSIFGVFAFPKFMRDFCKFKRMQKKQSFRFQAKFKDLNPYLGEATITTGFDHHYVYHPAWAARILAKTRPEFHIDISSTLHFCSIVSAFLPVKFYDYRPAHLELSNLTSGKADLLKLPFFDNEIKSLSCMHTVEHVGLGRYGDNLDPEGDIKAIKELIRVLAPGGNLLFVVPMGKPKLQFNAHRIYSYKQIIEAFKNLQLNQFSLITDDGLGRDFIENAAEADADRQNYGCGCFWFTKAV